MPINTDVNYYALIRMTRLSILAMFGNEASRHEIPILQATLDNNLPDWAVKLQFIMAERLANQEINSLVYPYMTEVSAEGEPFANFERDPAPISQIKKMVNGLYHIESLIQTTNNFKLSDVNYAFINNNTNRIYTICRLFTDPDVDLTSIFGEEIAIWMQMLEDINARAQAYSIHDLSYQAGHHSAMAINHLKPHNKGVDNTFLVEFTLALPGYLNELKNYINNQLNMDRIGDMDARNPEAMLQRFDDVVIQGVPLSNNKIYIHFIRPVLALQTDILHEIHDIKNVGFEVILAKFYDLKYVYFPKIEAFVDEIEEKMLLKRGLLVDPLMVNIGEIYSTLVSYAQSGTVDFSTRPELLLLHHTGVQESDSEFIEARLSPTYQRWATREMECEALENVIRAQEIFFARIETLSHERLSQLPSDVKQALIMHYAIIQPHMAAIDIKLSNIIVQSLLAPMPVDTIGNYLFDTVGPYLYNSLRTRLDYPDRIEKILEIKPQLINRLHKLIATHRFHQALNVDILQHVYKSMPYQDIGLVIRHSCMMITEHLHEKLSATKPIAIGDLVQDKMAEMRATRIVKQPIYSATIASIRTQLKTLFETHLNPAILQALQSVASPGLRDTAYSYLMFETNEIPFPELEMPSFIAQSNQIGVLGQPQQVLGLKRLANCLHHLEEASIQFELLDTQSTQIMYVKRIFEVQRHVTHAGLHFVALINDPYLLPILGKFTQSIQYLMGGLNVLRRDFKPIIGWDLNLRTDNSDLELLTLPKDKPTLVKKENSYFIYGSAEGNNWVFTELDRGVIEQIGINFTHDQELPYHVKWNDLYLEITEKKGHIDGEHDGLFYTINALSVLPAHINALDARQTSISLDTTTRAHQAAKQLSMHINRIISKTGRYLPLFLETGTAIYLMTELKRQLNAFVITANNAAWKNLEAINDDLLTSILIEADQWEDKYLTPGKVTLPLTQILDAYYQSLLTSLNLPATQHRRLSGSLEPINRRIEAVDARKKLAAENVAQLEKQQNALSDFILLNQASDWTSNGSRPRYLEQVFQALIPLLIELKKPCEQAYLDVCKGDETQLSLLLMNMTNGTLCDKAQRCQIEQIIKVGEAYFVGEVASQQLDHDIAVSKLTYLNAQKQVQENLNRANLETAAIASLNSHIAAYKGAYGITYDNALSVFVDDLAAQIVAQINATEDIDTQIKSLLEKNMLRFEAEQGVDCRQFEAIKRTLSRLNLYLEAQERELSANQKKSTAFESEDTLAKKRIHVRKLEGLLTREELSLRHRIQLIHDEIQQPEFKITMLAYAHENATMFEWLRQCINAFFELIHLYTSERKACYVALANVSEISPKTPPAIGFFQPQSINSTAENAPSSGLGPSPRG